MPIFLGESRLGVTKMKYPMTEMKYTANVMKCAITERNIQLPKRNLQRFRCLDSSESGLAVTQMK